MEHPQAEVLQLQVVFDAIYKPSDEDEVMTIAKLGRDKRSRYSALCSLAALSRAAIKDRFISSFSTNSPICLSRLARRLCRTYRQPMTMAISTSSNTAKRMGASL